MVNDSETRKEAVLPLLELVNLILSHPLRFLKGGKGTTIADPREI